MGKRTCLSIRSLLLIIFHWVFINLIKFNSVLEGVESQATYTDRRKNFIALTWLTTSQRRCWIVGKDT